jgi:hypothetical protein
LYTDATLNGSCSLHTTSENGLHLSDPASSPHRLGRNVRNHRVIGCCTKALAQPTTITLFTDSMIVFLTIVKRQGDDPADIPSPPK